MILAYRCIRSRRWWFDVFLTFRPGGFPKWNRNW